MKAAGEKAEVPQPVPEKVPAEHRAWMMRLTKADLAELTWLLAQDLYTDCFGDMAVARELVNQASCVLSNQRSVKTRLPKL